MTENVNSIEVAGQVVITRTGNELCFAVLRNLGDDIQVVIARSSVGDEQLAAWKRDIRPGDQITLTGKAAVARSGALLVEATSWVSHRQTGS